ncbi:DNA/RNA non-specific endonuclease [Levilactobacillus yonginensis]
MKKKQFLWIAVSLLLLVLGGCSNSSDAAKTKTVYNHTPEKQAVKLKKANSAEKKRLDAAQVKLDHRRATRKTTKKPSKAPTKKKTATKQKLADRTYQGEQEITINQNDPGFSKKQLATKSGAWQTYHQLDDLNRVTGAEALLNQSLMPTAKREPLTVDPTGWHNKRTSHGWLYNRSHLIGYQFTGQNNNLKNLMTGTRSLNNPTMLHNEMDVATYLKQSRHNYVRYAVTPIFKGQELVARGVQMRAQSIGSNAIHFNVYIFNVESGYKIDYSTGYSQAS